MVKTPPCWPSLHSCVPLRPGLGLINLKVPRGSETVLYGSHCGPAQNHMSDTLNTTIHPASHSDICLSSILLARGGADWYFLKAPSSNADQQSKHHISPSCAKTTQRYPSAVQLVSGVNIPVTVPLMSVIIFPLSAALRLTSPRLS